MSDTAYQNPQTPELAPPIGDPNQAQKYVNQLVDLISADRLYASQTDLKKFDPSALQDHYSLDLKGYKVEISHSKYPQTGKDSYIILFTNVKHITGGSAEKLILAYMHLDETQFAKLKHAFVQQTERKKRAEEERRLKEALMPIDQVLDQLENQTKFAQS
jgi:hypothetical protein